MSTIKRFLIIGIIVGVLLLIGDIMFYNWVASHDINNSGAIEISPKGFPEWQVQLITLENVMDFIILANMIILTFVGYVLYKLRDFIRDF